MVDLPDDQKSMVYLPKAEVDQLWTTFQQAEQQIKALERDEGDGLDVPSINQLRYVAHHLLKALANRNTMSLYTRPHIAPANFCQRLSPATNSASRCIPCHIVLAPGSPSDLRPK